MRRWLRGRRVKRYSSGVGWSMGWLGMDDAYVQFLLPELWLRGGSCDDGIGVWVKASLAVVWCVP